MPKAQWQTISNELREKITTGKLRPGERLPPEMELAARYSVSRPTANRAVQELKRLGYVTRQPGSGTVVARPQAARTGHLAILINATGDFPQVGHLRSVQEELAESYRLLLWDTQDNPALEARYLQSASEHADGILLWSTCSPEIVPELRNIVESGKPVVCLDCIPEGIEVDAVMSDNVEAVEQAFQFLRARGHQRIAYFGSEHPEISSVRERRAAFLAAARAAGDPTPEQRTRYVRWLRGGTICMQSLSDALWVLTHGNEPITAVLCQQDGVVYAILEACEAMGLRVPHDMEVAGFVDIPPKTDKISRQVHRIMQRTREIGHLAAERIVARLEGQTDLQSVVRVSADFYPATGLNGL